MTRGDRGSVILLAAMVLAFAAVVLLVGCTDRPGATSTLRAQGYTDVEITGWRPFTCSEDDWYRTGFVARSPSGGFVSGTVCRGLIMKGSTLRFD